MGIILTRIRSLVGEDVSAERRIRMTLGDEPTTRTLSARAHDDANSNLCTDIGLAGVASGGSVGFVASSSIDAWSLLLVSFTENYSLQAMWLW